MTARTSTAMVETADGKHAVLCDPGHPQHGWVFYRGPDGQWVTLRKASDVEVSLANATKRGREAVAAFEPPRDYQATVCGSCHRAKEKCCCSDGDCG